MPRVRKKTKRGSRPARQTRTEKHRGGRPTKYSRTVAARICRAVRKGCSREAAAGLAGINPDTLYDWQHRFPEFSEALQKADSELEAECVSNIRRAGRSRRNWTANAWLLERKFPHRYGKVDRHLLRVRRDEDEDLTQLPQAFIDAINEALGVKGPFIPIGPPLLENENGEAIDTEVLPQD